MSNGIFKFVQMIMKRLLNGEKRIPFPLQLSPLRLHSSHTLIMKLDKRTDFFVGGGGNLVPLSYEQIHEPWHGISSNVVCATSKASDQPAHTRSLIRAFARLLHIL